VNPVLAGLLTVFLVSVGLMLFYGVIAVVVAIDITLSAGALLSRDEVAHEIDKRWLGRFGHALQPVVLWWTYPLCFIWHLFRRRP
jgi:hypothetical protein